MTTYIKRTDPGEITDGQIQQLINQIGPSNVVDYLEQHLSISERDFAAGVDVDEHRLREWRGGTLKRLEPEEHRRIMELETECVRGNMYDVADAQHYGRPMPYTLLHWAKDKGLVK